MECISVTYLIVLPQMKKENRLNEAKTKTG